MVRLVEEYADPNIGAALGLQARPWSLKVCTKAIPDAWSKHADLPRSSVGKDRTILTSFFERDGIAYGVEIKNTLGYMDHDELRTKLELCDQIGMRPVFAVRMLPKTWINEIIDAGGFALILKYQLYPWAHRELARRVREKLGLPADAPRALEDGTMERFVRWHGRQL